LYNGKSILAVIPARGGSKGLIRKNLCDLAGKPLIAWTIEETKKSQYIDRCILSSEDIEIINVAKLYGCEVPFVRPNQFAQDDSTSIEVILHAISKINNYDYVVLLQPTSPLRSVEDIDKCIEKIVETNAPSCVSVTIPDKSPYWMYTLEQNSKMIPLIDQDLILRRQDLPSTFVLNGAVYIAKTEWFIENKSFFTYETVGYVMDKKRSYDIDTIEDLMICEYLIKKEVF
jgi:N-acylneuraminate cytidylyltransferase